MNRRALLLADSVTQTAPMPDVSFDALAKIRGAMWPQAGFSGLPYGPRPGDPTNIIDTGAWYAYDRATRDRITDRLHASGWTHVQYGPLETPGHDGYHGQFPTNSDWHVYLDDVEDLRARGFHVINFVHPDNWTFEQTRDFFTPLLAQPRAQQLLNILVPSGWEPAGYNWSSWTWAQYFSWARSLFPEALLLLHNATKADGSPYDAPVGTDAAGDDNTHPNGEGWQRVIDAGCDGWLIQNGPFAQPVGVDPATREFAAQFMADGDGATFHSIGWHFAHGIGGFPTQTARGKKFLLYNAEVTAYLGYWAAMPEAQREAWGDLAMRSGADGYLDGGTK